MSQATISRWFLIGLVLAGRIQASADAPTYDDLDAPPHRYRERTPKDPVSQLKQDLESGRLSLDRSSEKAFLLSFLKLLHVPASSQGLVFSTTSLQLSLISPSNPRAIYFSDDISVGYVPGGRIEVISLDPELGGIFYIFDVPKEGRALHFDRSARCMNCHAGEDTGRVPGWVVKSVVPGPGGGSLTAYRLEQSGHGIPFEERFGGWHVTGDRGLTNHLGNVTGQLSAGSLTKIPNPPGARFSFSKYPVETSDLLAQLLLEHQSGFVNRVVEAAYRTRTALHANPERLTPEQTTELESQAQILVRYLLFKDEAPLPMGGIEGDAQFKKDFLENRRAASGISLKDLDLHTRLFKHRCSYMIYTPVFEALPSILKQRVYQKLGAALRAKSNDPDYAYLTSLERESVRRILKSTLKDLPREWGQ